MALPVSIGDVMMLAKLAYRLGRIFTSERKSAPTEFREVQNQLFALSKALNLLATRSTSGPNTDEDSPMNENEVLAHQNDILGRMILNCRETLRHLEHVLEKYGELDSNSTHSDAQGFEKWRKEMKENWKKIKWTKEGGDLSKLRHNLAVHISGLDLAVSAITSSQTKHIGERVDVAHSMLEEIYQWFVENLKNSKPITPKRSVPTQTSNQLAFQAPSDGPHPTFQVYMELPDAHELRLLCPQAAFSASSLDMAQKDSDLGLLRCCCQRSMREIGDRLTSDEMHGHQLSLTLLPVSLLIRLAMQRPAWQVFLASRSMNRTISIVLTGVQPSGLALFERHVNQLALRAGLSSVIQGTDSMLAYRSLLPDEEDVLSVLNAKSDTTAMHGMISNVTLVSNGHRYGLGSANSVQLLHYKILPLDLLQATGHRDLPKLSIQRYAELVVDPTKDPSTQQDRSSYVVRFEYDTTVERVAGGTTVSLVAVDCIVGDKNGKQESISRVNVKLEFSSPQVTHEFIHNLHAMQRELLVTYLRHARYGEEVLFQKSAGNLVIRDTYVQDAQISVVLDRVRNEQRMILLSKDTSTCVCIQLSPALFGVATEPDPSDRNLDLPAFVVRIGQDETTISKESTNLNLMFSLTDEVQEHRNLTPQWELGPQSEPAAGTPP